MQSVTLGPRDQIEVLTESDVHRALEERDFSTALAGMLGLMGEAALAALRDLGFSISISEPDRIEAHIRPIAAATFLRSRVEGADSLSETQQQKAGAALDVLDAIGIIAAKLHEPAPTTEAGIQSLLAELLILGGFFGQHSRILDDSLSGFYETAAKAEQARQNRRAAQGKVAEAQTAWQAPALEAAKRICAEIPRISSARIADRISRDKSFAVPSTERVTEWVRMQRKSGALPPKSKQKGAF